MSARERTTVVASTAAESSSTFCVWDWSAGLTSSDDLVRGWWISRLLLVGAAVTKAFLTSLGSTVESLILDLCMDESGCGFRSWTKHRRQLGIGHLRRSSGLRYWSASCKALWKTIWLTAVAAWATASIEIAIASGTWASFLTRAANINIRNSMRIIIGLSRFGRGLNTMFQSDINQVRHKMSITYARFTRRSGTRPLWLASGGIAVSKVCITLLRRGSVSKFFNWSIARR